MIVKTGVTVFPAAVLALLVELLIAGVSAGNKANETYSAPIDSKPLRFLKKNFHDKVRIWFHA